MTRLRSRTLRERAQTIILRWLSALLMSALSALLMSRRRLRGLMQQCRLGQEARISGSRISLFERGEAGFPAEVLVKLADVLDLDPPSN